MTTRTLCPATRGITSKYLGMQEDSEINQPTGSRRNSPHKAGDTNAHWVLSLWPIRPVLGSGYSNSRGTSGAAQKRCSATQDHSPRLSADVFHSDRGHSARSNSALLEYALPDPCNTHATRKNRITMPTPYRITTGPERLILEGMLDRNRAELIDTVRGLSEEQARRRLVPSLTTSIGLLKHAAVAERIWFQRILAGLPESECDGGTTRGDASFIVGDYETVADVIAEFERASERSRTIAASFDLDETRKHPRVGEISLRWIYLLLIEDFARHAGHSDILREQITAGR